MLVLNKSRLHTFTTESKPPNITYFHAKHGRVSSKHLVSWNVFLQLYPFEKHGDMDAAMKLQTHSRKYGGRFQYM